MTTPPVRASFLPELTQSSPIPSGTPTVIDSSPFKSVAEYLRSRSKDVDPLANFRADSLAPPDFGSSLAIRPGVQEDDTEIPGIEDISESQWHSGGYASKDSGSDGSDRAKRSELRRLERERKRFSERDEGEVSPKRRREGNPKDSRSGIAHRGQHSAHTSADPSETVHVLRESSPISQNHDEDLDVYDQDIIDDELLTSLDRGDADGDGDHSGVGGGITAKVLDDGESEADDNASTSNPSTTPIPTSLVTPHEDSADEDEGGVHWTPSPMSPRTVARRRIRSTSVKSTKSKVQKPGSPAPLLIEGDSEPERRGDPGPSSSRSSTRKAALTAQARVRNAIVLSDDEDGDYDPFVGGDSQAFGRDYDRQVRKEEALPEETDGSDSDEVDAYDDGPEDPEEAAEDEQEDRHDHIAQSSQRVARIDPPDKRKYDAATTMTLGEPNRTRSLWTDQHDEYDNLPMDGLDAIDLDDLALTNPPPPAGAREPDGTSSARLSDLFSDNSPKRPDSTHARTPLADLPLYNIGSRFSHEHDPDSDAGPAPAPFRQPKQSGLLQQLDRATTTTSGPNLAPMRSSGAAPALDQGSWSTAESIMDEYGFIPVSKMPDRWREFYQNHWRRGADGAKTALNRSDFNEEDDLQAASTSQRGAKTARGRGRARGRGGSSRAASTQVPTQRNKRRDMDFGAEEGFGGDLGGPTGPPEERGGGRGTGRAWYAKRAGWAKKRGQARRK